jgi:hypothetical protein
MGSKEVFKWSPSLSPFPSSRGFSATPSLVPLRSSTAFQHTSDTVRLSLPLPTLRTYGTIYLPTYFPLLSNTASRILTPHLPLPPPLSPIVQGGIPLLFSMGYPVAGIIINYTLVFVSESSPPRSRSSRIRNRETTETIAMLPPTLFSLACLSYSPSPQLPLAPLRIQTQVYMTCGEHILTWEATSQPSSPPWNQSITSRKITEPPR